MMKQDLALTVPTELFLALYTVQTSDQQAVCTVFICKRNDFSVFFPPKLQKKFCYLRLNPNFQTFLLPSGPG